MWPVIHLQCLFSGETWVTMALVSGVISHYLMEYLEQSCLCSTPSTSGYVPSSCGVAGYVLSSGKRKPIKAFINEITTTARTKVL